MYEQVILDMNQSGVTVYSLDIPSGIHAKSAKVLGCAVQAEATITFGVNKTGLVLYPGCEYAGKVYVADIGFQGKALLSRRQMLTIMSRMILFVTFQSASLIHIRERLEEWL